MTKTGAYYTKALGRKVAKGAKPDSVTKIHVISGPLNTWSVVAEGSLRSIRSSLKKGEAMIIARMTAAKKSAKYVVVHDKNGDVSKRIPVSNKIETP